MAHVNSGVLTQPNGNGTGWVNKRAGKTVSTHRTQAAAIKAGRAEAKRRHEEHTIFGKDGKIKSKNSYGPDSRKTPG
jgi:hypothetical protein